MNYTQIMDSYNNKLKLLLFLENLNFNDDNFNSILFHNIAVSYYNLDQSKIDLKYMNKGIDLNSKKKIISNYVIYEVNYLIRPIFRIQRSSTTCY